MSTKYKELLKRKLANIEFAELYGISLAKDGIAVALYKAREASGKTQSELARELNVSQAYIAKLEMGKANPTVAKVALVLAHLGYSLDVMLEPLMPKESIADENQHFDWVNEPTDFFGFNNGAIVTANLADSTSEVGELC